MTSTLWKGQIPASLTMHMGIMFTLMTHSKIQHFSFVLGGTLDPITMSVASVAKDPLSPTTTAGKTGVYFTESMLLLGIWPGNA